MQRNPSHFGSKSRPSSCGTSCTALASIGFTGGITGSFTEFDRSPPQKLEPVLVMDVDDTPAEAAIRAEARAWLESVAKRRGDSDGAWRSFRAKTDEADRAHLQMAKDWQR